MNASRRTLLAALTAGSTTLLAAPSVAQEAFPSKPVRIVALYTTGGSGDALARAAPYAVGLGRRLTEDAKQ